MATKILRTQFIRLNPKFRLQWEAAQDCHVLLFPEGMIQLNESAGEILTRCQDETLVDSLISELEKQFPDADDLAADVLEFLEEANHEQWVLLS